MDCFPFYLFHVRHFFGFDPTNHAASLPVAASLPTSQQSFIAGSICDGSRNIENSHSALRIQLPSPAFNSSINSGLLN